MCVTRNQSRNGRDIEGQFGNGRSRKISVAILGDIECNLLAYDFQIHRKGPLSL